MIITRPLIFSWLNTIALAAAYLGIGFALDRIITGEPIGTRELVLVIAGPILAGLFMWAGNAGFPRALTRAESADRDAILRTVIDTPAAATSREWTGRTVSTATDAVERSANYRVTFLGPMIGAMTSPIIATLIIGFMLDWSTALWLMLVLPLIPVLIGGFQRAFSSVSKSYRFASRRLAARYLDAIQGLATLRALGAGRKHGDKLADEAENVRQHVMRMLLGNQLILLVSDAAFSLGMITLAAALAVERTVAGVLTPGQAVALVLISTLLLEPLDRIGQFFYIGMGGIAVKREIKRFVSARDEDERSLAAEKAAKTKAGRSQAPMVAFDRVSFGYREDQLVLDERDWQVRNGEHVAIVGPSGGGKSTLLNLIQGIYQPIAGTVSICGVDTSAADPSWLTAQIGIVAQSTYLFSGTLAHNLRIAAPDATDGELWEALDKANLSEVRDWPLGLDTQVGERGLTLSGGQAQRVAIARALLKDAPLLLLDEPTSQVDPNSEATILEALDRLAQGRTVISITHRTRTARAADRIYEMRGGQLSTVTKDEVAS